MNPTVTLVSHTANPIQTIYYLWLQSKSDQNLPRLEDINPKDPEVLRVFEGVINSHIPVSDSVSFVFALENISVSFREQMVRHRVGQTFGARIGVDIVPDIGNSSWWGQSMRILDMGKFATENRFRVPESLKDKVVMHRHGGVPAEAVYKGIMQEIEYIYNALVKAGVPMEDARDIIPLGATHRFSWTINLTALKHVIGKRGCWIPQLGLWKPIIHGMIEQLSTRIHPIFRNLINPPCIKDNKFKSCVYKIDNERRISREDQTLPCPLYMNMEHYGDEGDGGRWKEVIPENKISEFIKQTEEYGNLWNRDPWTGEQRPTLKDQSEAVK